MKLEEKQSLGRVIHRLRGELNLTQESLAAISGVPLRTVQRAEQSGAISKENLSALAQALKISSEALLQAAIENSKTSPELRLSLKQITQAGEVLRLVKKKGSLHLGPEGEQSFNQPWGDSWLNIEDLNDAKYALTITELFGFAVFGIHYQEKLQKSGKTIDKPVSLIIAVSPRDSRIYKTANGLALDYLVDSRRQLFGKLMSRPNNLADWRENQLLSKLNGEENVKTLDRLVLKLTKRSISKASRS